jgi:hypothetical protein
MNVILIGALASLIAASDGIIVVILVNIRDNVLLKLAHGTLREEKILLSLCHITVSQIRLNQTETAGNLTSKNAKRLKLLCDARHFNSPID